MSVSAKKPVFLSYASQDAEAALGIAEALREMGVEVWFDRNELVGGDAWDASIRKQIKECALFVPIISANTNARSEGYFRLEWKLAVDRSHLMAEDQAFFMPVVLGDTAEASARVPDKFRERQWSRSTDAASMAAFAKRVRALTTDAVTSGEVQAPGSAKPAPKSMAQSNPETVPSLPPPIKPAPIAKAIPVARQQVPKRTWLNRRTGVAAGAIVLLASVIAGGWVYVDRNNKAVFVAAALPRIEEMATKQQYVPAFQLANEVERAGGAELLTKAVREVYSREVNIQSEPPQAAVAFRAYGAELALLQLGATPLEKIRVPRGLIEFQVTLAGYRPSTFVTFAETGQQFHFALLAENSPDADMVPVSGGDVRLSTVQWVRPAPKVTLPRFLMDRTEVSNRDYARFLRADGYAKREYWKHPFRQDGKEISFETAMQRFRDVTGRAGPSTWKLGSFPDGEEDFPVRGISWYEADAYLTFAGKQLPTIYHWYRADTGNNLGYFPSAVLPLSNFDSKAPRKVAEGKSLGAFGAINMAGNVREWVSNPLENGQQMLLGGAWSDPSYVYMRPERREAFDRSPENGVRGMKRVGSEPIPEVAYAKLPLRPLVDVTRIKPATDAEYAVFTRFFEQRHVALDAKIEAVDESSPHWVRQKVSYAAGYGGERIWSYLYLPRNARPPFQTIIHMGGSASFAARPFIANSDYPTWAVIEMLVRGGRAVMIPIWKGTHDRNDGYTEGQADNAAVREKLGQWVSELGQSIDYLSSRLDFDAERIAYHGFSTGAVWAPNFLALELRLKTGILLLGGIGTRERSVDIDPVSYAPRVKVPVLMLNTRNDANFPYETGQLTLFNLLGTPANQKLHRIFPGGHSLYGWYEDMVREHYDWLDKTLGPVSLASASTSKSSTSTAK